MPVRESRRFAKSLIGADKRHLLTQTLVEKTHDPLARRNVRRAWHGHRFRHQRDHGQIRRTDQAFSIPVHFQRLPPQPIIRKQLCNLPFILAHAEEPANQNKSFVSKASATRAPKKPTSALRADAPATLRPAVATTPPSHARGWSDQAYADSVGRTGEHALSASCAQPGVCRLRISTAFVSRHGDHAFQRAYGNARRASRAVRTIDAHARLVAHETARPSIYQADHPPKTETGWEANALPTRSLSTAR